MEFDAALQVLASRPAHTHDHCERAPTHEQNPCDEVNEVAVAITSDLKIDAATASNDSVPVETRTIPELGRAFFAHQEQRVQIYSAFQEGFNKFKATAQFEPFCTFFRLGNGRITATNALWNGVSRCYYHHAIRYRQSASERD
jgi:hypothetical protein